MTDLQWKQPPESRRILSDEVLAELRARPGEWALLRTWTAAGHNRPVKHPADVELRRCYSRAANTTELYARAKET